MRAAIVFVTAVLAAFLQVDVAPLFPFEAAVPELGVVAVVLILLGFGARAAMVATPIYAVTLGLLSSRAPGLIVFAYLPAVPLAFVVESLDAPLGRFVRIAAVALGAGAWARLVLAGGALATGAPLDATVLIRDLMLPGVLFDFVLISLAYVPCRIAGWTDRPLLLPRGGWL